MKKTDKEFLNWLEDVDFVHEKLSFDKVPRVIHRMAALYKKEELRSAQGLNPFQAMHELGKLVRAYYYTEYTKPVKQERKKKEKAPVEDLAEITGDTEDFGEIKGDG